MEALSGASEPDPEAVLFAGQARFRSEQIEIARTGAPVACVVSFHGLLETKQRADDDSGNGKKL